MSVSLASFALGTRMCNTQRRTAPHLDFDELELSLQRLETHIKIVLGRVMSHLRNSIENKDDKAAPFARAVRQARQRPNSRIFKFAGII